MSLLHSSFYVQEIIKNYLFDENLIISSDYKQMLHLKEIINLVIFLNR